MGIYSVERINRFHRAAVHVQLFSNEADSDTNHIDCDFLKCIFRMRAYSVDSDSSTDSSDSHSSCMSSLSSVAPADCSVSLSPVSQITHSEVFIPFFSRFGNSLLI